ncbi:MAG: PQQ-binding-like beta-propeller repeat protein [Actinomycetaceae bacterium]|nr:PQQ-binding-like beta-propeller repeat protein [Actinomycetaceae bacterium]
MAIDRHRWAKRVATLLVVILVVVLLAVLASSYVLKNRTSAGDSAKGPFAAEPGMTRAITPATYGVKSFVPLLGTGNSTAPVGYEHARVMAGVTDSGASVLIGLGDTARATWQTSLTGPLVTCSAVADGDQLPCLVKSSTGSLVAVIDLKTGAARWIWEDDQVYMNLTVNGDHNVVLLGEDMSLTAISMTGVMVSEPMISQGAAEKQWTPDTKGCPVGASSTIVPEAFKQLSSTMYLVSHGGINTLVDVSNNQVIAAIPGTILHDDKDETGRWVIAPQGGCTPAAVVTPSRNRIQLLPEDVSVPVPSDRSIPEVVLRGGRLHMINWDGPAVGRQAYPPLSLSFNGAPRMASTDKIGVVAGDSVVTAFTKDHGRELWDLDVEVHDMRIADDILIVNTKDGHVMGVGLATGMKLWDLPDSALGHLSLPDEQTIAIDSQTGMFQWKAGAESSDGESAVNAGAGASVGDVAPGITYSTSTCVRVRKQEGDENRYSALSVPLDCSLGGAEPVVGILAAETKPRGGDIADYLSTCQSSFPRTVSVLTVTSPRADGSISALCLGNPAEKGR